jgi:hypothetical protein
MRTTQGQAAFGHNVQAIITYSNMVKTFSNWYRWTRLFNARRTHLLRSSNTHKESSHPTSRPTSKQTHTNKASSTPIPPFQTPPNTAPYEPKPPPTGRISHSTPNTPPSPTFSLHTNNSSCWEVHNSRLLAHNPTLRCPMYGQFTSNGPMVGNSPSMSRLRQDMHNNALLMLLSLLERHNGGRWETITADFGNKPIKSFASPIIVPMDCAATLHFVSRAYVAYVS